MDVCEKRFGRKQSGQTSRNDRENPIPVTRHVGPASEVDLAAWGLKLWESTEHLSQESFLGRPSISGLGTFHIWPGTFHIRRKSPPTLRRLARANARWQRGENWRPHSQPRAPPTLRIWWRKSRLTGRKSIWKTHGRPGSPQKLGRLLPPGSPQRARVRQPFFESAWTPLGRMPMQILAGIRVSGGALQGGD